MGGAGAPMPSWLELWNEWEIQVVVVASFSLQVILFFFAGIRRYSVSSVLKVLLWLVYLLADVVATYALGHMSSSLSKKSSSEHQLVAFWAPFLLLHLGGQDTITAYALEDNKLWLRHLLNMFVQVAGAAYVLYKYIIAGGATFVHAAMLVLAAGVIKCGERIWAMKLASKGGSAYGRRPRSQHLIRAYDACCMCFTKKPPPSNWNIRRWWLYDCFTKNKQFRLYAFTVMEAHALGYLLVKPLVINRYVRSHDWYRAQQELVRRRAHGYLWEDDQSEDASAKEKRQIGEIYKAIEVELALMYDILYTKAQVIHGRRGQWIRAISSVCCFAALVVFTKSTRDGYSTPNIVVTFALLGGACALEVASFFRAIGSTWTYAILTEYGWNWLANAILFARYHLVVKDGRWSNSVGQFNFLSFCVHSNKYGLKVIITRLIGLGDLWNKARCTKHVKLSPTLKEFVWHLLKGAKSHMVEIEEVAIQSGNWARRFRGFAQSEQLDWSLSFEFQKSVLIWHIATDTFLNRPAIKSELVDKDMAEEVNTLSHYMMYLLVQHPDILPKKPAAPDLLDDTCRRYRPNTRSSEIHNVLDSHQILLDYKERQEHSEHLKELYDDLTNFSWWDDCPGEAVLLKASVLVWTMLDMDLELTHKMAILGTVWTEMLCFAATNASGEFHARQLSNGGEFLTHILLLIKYAAPIPLHMAADEDPQKSNSHVMLADNDCKDEIIEIRECQQSSSNPVYVV